MVFIYHLLGGDGFFFCFYGNGHAVLVAAANKLNVFAFAAQIAHVNIGGQVATCKVANVHGPVGVGQGGGYKMSFKSHNSGVKILRLFVGVQLTGNCIKFDFYCYIRISQNKLYAEN